MLTSMTGFSAKTQEITLREEAVASLTVEMKALNSRFFEMTFRVPSWLSFLETTVQSRLKEI